MYEDDPEWQVYMNAMKLMYKVNPINIDIAGSIESISKLIKRYYTKPIIISTIYPICYL